MAGAVTGQLIAAGRAIRADGLAADVLEMARLCVLDWLGVAIAGANEELVTTLRAEALDEGGRPVCTLPGREERLSPGWAALVNATAADALDYSDINRAMRGHSTPAVVAAALAAAEARAASGLDLLAAVVAGIEVECRLGALLELPCLRQGFHPTAMMAHFGAAAAVSHLLRLDEAGWAHALGIAATQAAGLVASAGTMAKPFHSGKAAMNGLLAANLAARGFVGRPDAIEAPEGFIETHASGQHADALQRSAGRFFILDTIFKRHAACMLSHSSIENILSLRNDHGVGLAGLSRIDVSVPASTLAVCGIDVPATGLEAKFSLRAVCAMALLGDDTGDVRSYTLDRVTRPELGEWMRRITVRSEEIGYGSSRAQAQLADGRTVSVLDDAYQPLRDPNRRREAVSKKFRALAGSALGATRASRLERNALGLDRLDAAADVFQ
jgi:2-methylcitrate dehydratase PrpD